ncbi:major facilitator superfamily domain-containing protein [Paraphysoderma sedebokerense]|nr:major facilitator superfamily domain-containing protein [Paraphysoderma sedebokerense]
MNSPSLNTNRQSSSNPDSMATRTQPTPEILHSSYASNVPALSPTTPNIMSPITPLTPIYHPSSNTQSPEQQPVGCFGRFMQFRKSKKAVQVVVGISLFVDMVVYGIVVPILPVIIQDKLHGDETAVGILFGSYALGLLIATPPVALLSDRYHARKGPMLLGLLGLSFTTVMFAFAVEYWQLVLARVMQGVAAGASWTVGLSLLADVFPPEKLGSAIGPVMSCNHLGFLVGPPLGGALFQLLGYSAPFYVCASLALLNFGVRLWVDESDLLVKVDRDDNVRVRGKSGKSQKHQRQTDGPGEISVTLPTLRTESSEGKMKNKVVPIKEQSYGSTNITPRNSENFLKVDREDIDRDGRNHTRKESGMSAKSTMTARSVEIRTTPSLWSLLQGRVILLNSFVIVVVGGIFAALEPTLPMHLSEQFALSPGLIGAVFVALVVPNIFMASIAGYFSDRYGGKKVMWVGLILMTLLTPLPALPRELWLEVVVLVLYGGVNAVVLTPILPMMGAYVHSRGGGAYAQVYAIFNLAYSLGILFGPIMSGFIISHSSFLVNMFVYTGMLVLLMITYWYFDDDRDKGLVYEGIDENVIHEEGEDRV